MKHEWHKPWTSTLGKLSQKRLSSTMCQEDRLALADSHKALMDEWLESNELTVLPAEEGPRLNPAGIPRNSLVTV